MELPTYEQLISLAGVCQNLSNFYRPIVLVRHDTSRNIFFILAGIEGTLELLIYPDGRVEFGE